MKPQISIIVPVYNLASLIGRALESVLDQSFGELEILLVDDASTDGGSKICREYAQKDSRIKYHQNQKNQGGGKSRNAAIQKAKGKYLLFLDGDDFFEPNALNKIILKAKSSGSDLIVFGFNQLWEENLYAVASCTPCPKNIKPGDEFESYLLNINGFGPFPWIYLYRRDLIISNNIKFSKGVCCNDIPFTSKAVYFSEKIDYIAQPLYNYYRRKGSITLSRAKQKVKDRIKAYEGLGQFIQQQGGWEQYKDAFLIRLLAFCYPLALRDYNDLKTNEKSKGLKKYFRVLKSSPLLGQSSINTLYHISQSLEDDQKMSKTAYKNAYHILTHWIKN